ncbi:MAG: DUF4013 domain-containing protein [Candidatus Obscuribacterales bacterium]|nr:DUF4013 domain-containing protein [Candidatus Obscuribacterales bacterium]
MSTEATPALIGLDPDLAVKSFFQDKDWVFKSAVGGAFNIVSILLLVLSREAPLLILLCFSLWAINGGFVLRTIRQKLLDAGGKLPEWGDWQDLFVSGMSWLAVATGCFLIVGTAGFTNLLVGATLSLVKTYTDSFVVWMSVSLISTALIALTLNFILTMMMVNFAEQESMRSAFNLIKVIKRISSSPRDFLSAWLLGLGIQLLGVLIPTITVVGIMFLPSVMFASQLLAASIVAQAWACTADRQSVKAT